MLARDVGSECMGLVILLPSNDAPAKRTTLSPILIISQKLEYSTLSLGIRKRLLASIYEPDESSLLFSSLSSLSSSSSSSS